MAQQPAKPTEAQNQTIETLNPNTTHAQAQHHSGTATHTFGGSRTRTRAAAAPRRTRAVTGWAAAGRRRWAVQGRRTARQGHRGRGGRAVRRRCTYRRRPCLSLLALARRPPGREP